MEITIQKLALSMNIPESLTTVWVSPLDERMLHYGINTPLRQAHFLAQYVNESNSFKSFRENLNYSVEGLLKTFSRSRISEAEAKKYRRIVTQPANQEMITNITYGGDCGWKGMV